MSEEVEVKARQFGWVPKEEFRGGEEKWVDAETFVRRGEEINPILRANNERLKKELDTERAKHQAEIDEIKATAEEFKKFQKDSYERKQETLTQEINTLKQERREAIKEGDGDRVVELEDRLEELKEQQAETAPKVTEPKQAEVQLDPVLKSWLDRNKWYGSEVETTELTNAISNAIRRENPTLVGEKFLEKLDERLQARFPELYENPNRSKNPVDSSSSGGSKASSGKRGYENLPAEAKTACDKFVKQGLFKTREEYVNLYQWD